ncbi:MAG: hypothetical protein JWN98_237 [Abditibacteriota bacterium]|nr:hypothetical protein [Abditibacteriota bacterium]
MISRILIPQAFENMEEATIGRWLKSEGEAVALGDGLCELITEKTTFDLPAEAVGVLRQITAPEKSVVPVGYIIGLIGDVEDELPDVTPVNAAMMERPKTGEGDEPAAMPSLSVPSLSVPKVGALAAALPAASGGSSRLRATPAARRAAREKGVDLEQVAAANPGKVLSEEDVAKFAG